MAENREKKNQVENNPSPELEISLRMEDKLRNIQEQLTNKGLSEEKRQELQTGEAEVLAQIGRRAKEMHREKEKEEKINAETIRKRIARDLAGDDMTKNLENIKEKFINFMKASEDHFSQQQFDKVEKDFAACRGTTDKEVLIEKIAQIAEPFIEFRQQQEKIFEQNQRDAMSKASLDRQIFIPIEDTHNIIHYGDGGDRIHLHLAPMRTMSAAEKLEFMKKNFPAAMEKLVELLKSNPRIKNVTAASYIVAASQKLFTDRLGFTKIGPMKKEWRLQYFGDCDMPVLRVAMTREEFLAKWGNKGA